MFTALQYSENVACRLQLHLWGGPGLCAGGGRGSERAAAAGWLDGGRRYFLPWGVHLEHVRNEPGTLPTVPRGQKSGAAWSPSTYHFYFFRGNVLLNTAHLKDTCTVTSLSLSEISCVVVAVFLSPPRAITLWRKGQPLWALGQTTSSL